MSAALPDFNDFAQNHDAGRAQLVWQWLSADLETPVSAWLKLCAGQPYSFLLESVEGGAVLGRYSALGFDPDLLWRAQDGRAAIKDLTNPGSDWSAQSGGALTALRALLAECKIILPDEEQLPPMAASGLFGFMGYDMIRQVENIPDANPDPLGLPDSLLMRPGVMVIFDNVKNMLCITVPVYPGKTAARDAAQAKALYQAALDKIAAVRETLAQPLASGQGSHQTALQNPLPVSAPVSRAAYHDMVEQAKDYIRAGDIFQVVPSQRMSVPFDLPAFDLYRALRRLNPSPFLFCWQFGDFALVGSSPEVLVRVRGGTITIRPIAGTRKRGANAAEDQALAAELLADPKERAEHLMLLDLGRNDVGRVAEIGSVSVTESFKVEYYSHVMHIVSNVQGRLRPELDAIDALFSGFPAGTVSGAPKIRAMEIIDELEPVRRGFYAGACGYLGGNGDIDTAITLRSALLKDGQLYVQAGGGVVADSDPEAEYQESLNKARALLAAAEQAVDKARS